MTRPPTAYVRAILGAREPLLDTVLRSSLLDHGLRPMQIDDNAARVLQLLTLIHRPQRVLEIGTFFGWSSIHIARGLPPGGILTTLEIDPEIAELARHNLELAGLLDSVEVVVRPAAEYLARLAKKTLDMVFIDADKTSYPQYLKLAYPLLRSGGLLVADDAFATGDFAPESDGDGAGELAAINTYNRAVGRSANLFSAFIGTNNGLLVSVKR